MELWAIPQISTGDLIRENIRLGTAVGSRFKEMVAAGIFVPDGIVNQMVAERIAQPDCKPGFVLDGFPRTAGQADWLDLALQDPTSAAGGRQPLVAVSIIVRYDELLRRITGRRTGSLSKRIYNVYTNPPRVPGVCDIDGEPLVQRPDDSEAVFEERMRVFSEQTEPVIQHYRHLGRFEEVDGDQPVEVVTQSILAALRRMRGN